MNHICPNTKYNNWKRNEKRPQWFLTEGWVDISLKGGCVVEISLRFSYEIASLQFCGMKVYIVGVKGRKVTLYFRQTESFTGTSRDGLSREVLAKW